jgi:hypothetical protein
MVHLECMGAERGQEKNRDESHRLCGAEARMASGRAPWI